MKIYRQHRFRSLATLWDRPWHTIGHTALHQPKPSPNRPPCLILKQHFALLLPVRRARVLPPHAVPDRHALGIARPAASSNSTSRSSSQAAAPVSSLLTQYETATPSASKHAVCSMRPCTSSRRWSSTRSPLWLTPSGNVSHGHTCASGARNKGVASPRGSILSAISGGTHKSVRSLCFLCRASLTGGNFCNRPSYS